MRCQPATIITRRTILVSASFSFAPYKSIHSYLADGSCCFFFSRRRVGFSGSKSRACSSEGNGRFQVSLFSSSCIGSSATAAAVDAARRSSFRQELHIDWVFSRRIGRQICPEAFIAAATADAAMA